MKITKDEVLYVAKLARLNLSDDEVEKFAGQIGDVLSYIETLNKVDTEGINPTSHANFLSNAFRKDEVKENFGVEKALSNAPLKENGHFVVPKIVG
ncbi:MAG: Asp-tRNA(Asn)/Glu-tRNA(Gln) amidotransferase subunit GatC [Desulfobacterales bacterium]|nr:Asp-tRNA(Asn)/Glu-tRNA(Gln) amidotransferase subunit GatC [Desulfobacterales bacterium]MCP4161456.1 Asp-tRNA(Asn)/Glu-tRNA(Gln) amidotransferase subunit GatC [Deltaproteobacteria bacterium]